MATTEREPSAAPPLDAEPSTPPRHRTVAGGRSRRSRFAIGFLALLFFFGPNAARLFVGEPGEIENRPLRTFPRVSDGWDGVKKLDGWAIDHLPLRDRAVKANSATSERLFGELPANNGTPSPTVLGRDGWLFLRDDFEQRCMKSVFTNQTYAGVERLSRLVSAGGKRFAFLVPPDKSAIETEMLPSAYPKKGCATAADKAMWDRFAAAPPVGYLDLYGPLRRIKAEHGHAYYKLDSHWNQRGDAEFGRAIADWLSPELGATTRFVESGTEQRVADLAVIAGRPSTERSPKIDVVRPGVTTQNTAEEKINAYLVVRSRASSSDSTTPLHPGRALLIGDSFAEHSLAAVQPYFADLTFLHRDSASVVRKLAEYIAVSDTVVMTVVQRGFNQSLILSTHFLDTLEAELAAVQAGR